MTTLALLERRPISLRAANAFVVKHHRHCQEDAGWLFGTSLWVGDELRSVAIAGRPKGKGLQDGFTVEITRVCTLGDQNACSMLYGALWKALGYRRAVTYTLADEPGISPAAAGFVLDEILPARETWAGENRHRYDHDLFGNERRPPGKKKRWVRWL
jgi:hypothetical protein